MKQIKIRLHTAFVFNIRVELISKGAKVTELRRYKLNFIGLCMFLNLPNVTHLSLRIFVFCIFKRSSNTVCFGGNHITIRETVIYDLLYIILMYQPG